MLGASLAAVICLWVGVIVLALQHRYGIGVKVVLGASLIRLFVVAGLAGLTYWLHGGLDGRSFLISLGVIYLSALTVETWILHSEAPHRVIGK